MMFGYRIYKTSKNFLFLTPTELNAARYINSKSMKKEKPIQKRILKTDEFSPKFKQPKAKKFDPIEQMEMLISAMIKGQTVTSFIKKIESYYKASKNSEKTIIIDPTNKKKLIDLILSVLKIGEKSIIPSLLYLVGIICRDNCDIGAVEIEIIIQTMKLYPNDEEIQKTACETLDNLTKTRKILTWIRRRRGFEMISQAMELYPNNVDIQYYGCGILWNLTTIDEGRMVVASKRGVEMTLQAMKLHCNHIGVQERTCKILSSLTYNDYINPLIEYKGGIEMVLRAMNSYPIHVAIRENAIKALEALAMNTKNKRLMNKLGYEI